MRYYKIFNDTHKHNGMLYKKGLNTDSIPFNSNPNDSCVPGGLYFSDKDNICEFLDSGVFIREIEIPKNEVIVTDYNKYRSHSIILKKKHDLRQVNTWKWMIKQGINIHVYDDLALRVASDAGNLKVVKFLVEKGADIHAYNDLALRHASANGHLDVVKFLVEKGADIHAMNDYALTWASQNGHIDIVNYIEGLD